MSIPVDSITVISLIGSEDRRIHVASELNKHGMGSYAIFDAVGTGSQDVEYWYSSNKVLLYPPCFRCGKRKCACKNNVLIESQVATFLSHRGVWEGLLNKTDGLHLIVEDDIKFNWYYRVFKKSYSNVLSVIKKESSNYPVLIRLAWAHNKEHRIAKPRYVSNVVRMSNPMYCINNAMAELLLRNSEYISTTADIFAHKVMSSSCSNYTIFPPLAHELSYSKGTFESLIRPREVRLEKINKKGNIHKENYNKEIDRYSRHIDRAIHRKILAVGHPRTGSGYISKLLSNFGLDVGHEIMGDDGIVSWMFSVFDLNNPYYLNKYAKSRYYSSFDRVLLFGRDPLTAIPSIIRENAGSEKSLQFRSKHICNIYNVNLLDITSPIEKAIQSYYYWTLISMLNNPSLILRVEDCDGILKKYLESIGQFQLNETMPEVSKDVNKNKLYKGKYIEKITLSHQDWLGITSENKYRLNRICDIFGYPKMYDSNNIEYVRVQ